MKYYYVRQGVSGRELVTVDPVSGHEEVWVSHLPEGNFLVAPTEDYLLFTLVQKGPEEKKEIYEFIDPDDRQPGWRNRTYLARFDVKTGVCQPLTFGYKNVGYGHLFRRTLYPDDGFQPPYGKTPDHLVLRVQDGCADLAGGRTGER